MNTELCFGQRIDQELGILEPWYTNPAMDRIKQFDLSGKVVMEWGSGWSTLWWSKKANRVLSVDHSLEWVNKMNYVLNHHRLNQIVRFVETFEGDHSEKRDQYVKMYADIKFDICIVDGIHRYECAEYAVNHFKPELLIIDNHQQDYVFMCPKLDELLEGVRMERYIQPDHTNHEGNPWATAIFFLK